MASDWIVEAVNVTANRFFGLPPCLEACAPDQLRFDCLEDGLNDGIIIAIAFATHGRDHAGPFNEPAIVVGTILAAPVGMMNETGQWLAHDQGHSSPDPETLHPPTSTSGVTNSACWKEKGSNDRRLNSGACSIAKPQLQVKKPMSQKIK